MTSATRIPDLGVGLLVLGLILLPSGECVHFNTRPCLLIVCVFNYTSFRDNTGPRDPLRDERSGKGEGADSAQTHTWGPPQCADCCPLPQRGKCRGYSKRRDHLISCWDRMHGVARVISRSGQGLRAHAMHSLLARVCALQRSNPLPRSKMPRSNPATSEPYQYLNYVLRQLCRERWGSRADRRERAWLTLTISPPHSAVPSAASPRLPLLAPPAVGCSGARHSSDAA